MKFLSLIVLIACAARTQAASVIFDHPAVKSKLTVHTLDGADRPDALTYEGPLGHFLVGHGELAGLAHTDGWSHFEYDVYALKAAGLEFADASYSKPKLYAFTDDDAVRKLESVIGALEAKGKQEAPDEFAARVADLRRRAARARMTFNSMSAEAKMAEGSIKDPDALAQQEKPITLAEQDVAACAAQRVTGEADAARAPVSTQDPNPKADFYWRQSLKLDSASNALFGSQYALDNQRMPAY